MEDGVYNVRRMKWLIGASLILLAIGFAVHYDSEQRSMRCTVLANKVQMRVALTYSEMRYNREHCDLYPH